MNVWKLVSRLRDPEQFAKFIISGSSEHVTEDEVQKHLEWIKNGDDGMKHRKGNLHQTVNKSCATICSGHRFNCILCDNDNGKLGHRFNCRKCFFDP